MWVAACPDDMGFLRHFPEVAAQQQKAWRDKEKDLQSILSALERDVDVLYPGSVVLGGGQNGHAAAGGVPMDVSEAASGAEGGGGGGESRLKSKKKR